MMPSSTRPLGWRRVMGILMRHCKSPDNCLHPSCNCIEDLSSGLGGCSVCAGPPLKFGTGCTLHNCPYSPRNFAVLLQEALPYVAMKLSTADLVERIENALKTY